MGQALKDVVVPPPSALRVACPCLPVVRGQLREHAAATPGAGQGEQLQKEEEGRGRISRRGVFRVKAGGDYCPGTAAGVTQLGRRLGEGMANDLLHPTILTWWLL
jgi:hypothetical protein